MKPLTLNQLSENSLRVSKGKLIANGQEYDIPAIDFDVVFVMGRGYVSFDVLKVLYDIDVPLIHLALDGSVMSQLTHSNSQRMTDGRIRLRQIRVVQNKEKCRQITNHIIRQKHRKSNYVLNRMNLPEINELYEERQFASQYFPRYLRRLSELTGLEHHNRKTFDIKHNHARDRLNAALNFGYSIIYQHVRKSLLSEGYELTVGFDHVAKLYKEPLVYDIAELLRWTVDLSLFNIHDQLNPKNFNVYGNREFRCSIPLIHSIIDEIYSTIDENWFNSQLQWLRTEL